MAVNVDPEQLLDIHRHHCVVGAEYSSSRRRAGMPRLWNDQDHWLKWQGAINQVILGASLLSGVVAKGCKWQHTCSLSLSDVVDSSGRGPSPWKRGGSLEAGWHPASNQDADSRWGGQSGSEGQEVCPNGASWSLREEQGGRMRKAGAGA